MSPHGIECITDPRKYIAAQDKAERKEKMQKRLMGDTETTIWWEEAVTNAISMEEQDRGNPRFIRKLRSSNIPNRKQLKMNVKKHDDTKKNIDMKIVTRSTDCIVCQSGEEDDLTHLMECKGSQPELEKMEEEIQVMVKEEDKNLEIKRYWLKRCDRDVMDRKSKKYKRLKKGSMGFFPKKQIKKISQIVQSRKIARKIAGE